MKMGIIAEDDSDVAVISVITLKLLKPHIVGFKKFVSGGCGKLQRKCSAWARILVQQGCSWIVVIHDLDDYNERKLRNQLAASVAPAGAQATVVLIPKREIEAWLLYDSKAIAAAFRQTLLLALPGNPESLWDPKKYLRDLVWKKYRKVYINTLHNFKIAEHIKVSTLRRSRSFSPHFNFAVRVAAMLR
jgi:hypothetical protein